jgi:hypothetical protein
MGCPLLARVPFEERTVSGGDAGTPAMIEDPDGAGAFAFRTLARQVCEALALYAAAAPEERHAS